jgi:hypothetical protein
MPTLFARRYMREGQAVGKTEKTLGVLILLGVAAIIAAFVVEVATNQDSLFDVAETAYGPAAPGPADSQAQPASVASSETENPFPEPGIEGWRAPGRVNHFTADNLYVKIDGRAAAYLEHGVVGLTAGTYEHRGEVDRLIDVYWYDMGTSKNALAMYRSEEAPEAAPVSIGQAGYQVGGAVFFCDGSSYVQVLPSRSGDADAQVALKIAERLAARIDEK